MEFTHQELLLERHKLFISILELKGNETGTRNIFILHHGAGQSSKTFYLLVESLQKILMGMNVIGWIVIFDCRYHGQSVPIVDSVPSDQLKTHISGDIDLSLEALTSDFIHLVDHVYRDLSSSAKLFLIGHSMGASVVINAMNTPGFDCKRVQGLVVLDLVEGTAIESLADMSRLLATRPTSFKSEKDALEWYVRNGGVKNRESVAISAPALFKKEKNSVQWIIDLRKTAPFWEQWFQGMSMKFLAAKTGKLLVLAGTDRLDKELTIAQMQGKYQMQVLTDSGHFVQEDQPEKLAELIGVFWKRNQPLDLKLIKKIDKMNPQLKQNMRINFVSTRENSENKTISKIKMPSLNQESVESLEPDFVVENISDSDNDISEKEQENKDNLNTNATESIKKENVKEKKKEIYVGNSKRKALNCSDLGILLSKDFSENENLQEIGIKDDADADADGTKDDGTKDEINQMNISKVLFQLYKTQPKPLYVKSHSKIKVIIVASDALRCLKLVKDLKMSDPKLKVAKLFARHMKLNQQIEALKKDPFLVGVGTPQRVSQILSTASEAINIKKLDFLVIDASYKNKKNYTITDLPETYLDLKKLYSLVCDHVETVAF